MKHDPDNINPEIQSRPAALTHAGKLRISELIKNKPPVSVWIASIFIVVCSVALIIFGIAILIAGLRAFINPNTPRLQIKGYIYITVFIAVGIRLLINGIYALHTKRQPALLLTALAIPLVIGSIGEIIDLCGTASNRSNLIGAGILVLFALPIGLLLLPSSKKWYAQGRGEDKKL